MGEMTIKQLKTHDSQASNERPVVDKQKRLRKKQKKSVTFIYIIEYINQ